MFEFNEYSVHEGEQVELCILLNGESEIDVPVEIMLQDITTGGMLAVWYFVFVTFPPSIGGNDYALDTQMLIFLPGDNKKCFPVFTINDDIFEDDELLNLNLNSSVVHTSQSTTLFIIDNDGKPYYN